MRSTPRTSSRKKAAKKKRSEHGDLAMYVNHHCRCARCRRANRDQQRYYRDGRPAQECLNRDCAHRREGRPRYARGLCLPCYYKFSRLVKIGRATWFGITQTFYRNPSKHDK